MPKPAVFKTAKELVAFRCTKERIDEGGVTTWQVVDRFAVPPEPRVLGPFSDEQEADDVVTELRTRRLASNLDAFKVAI